ncbi:hypothetical protein Zm00014a_012741 [Zea mays]|jgi:hypothetical protein|uniref:Uncharacterized protein n=1 Tax=Zea mays TaxID=4577 RepID=A0A3L6DUH6_MAIZE|nr:hypothetical protein Zm00014a_012741 [Zea mays]
MARYLEGHDRHKGAHCNQQRSPRGSGKLNRRLAKCKQGTEKKGVPLLPGGVPDLRLDELVVDLDSLGGELDADGGPGLEAELVPGEPRQQLSLGY